MDYSMVIGGEAGQGLLSIENYVLKYLAENGFYFFATKNYMSRIRGGHNYHMIRVADFPIHALKHKKWNLLVALDQESMRWHRSECVDQAIVYAAEDIQRWQSTLDKDQPKAINKYIADKIITVITEVWQLKKTGLPQYLFNGNQALAFGALQGGCQFVAGYPMTPGTSILDYCAVAARDGLPIHFEQAEDEIAAINMSLGASYAGLRAMVATSGGGFALMQEGVSLAGMTETPIVIMNIQRPGPATGLPTRTEQADLNLVLHSGHGEFPRVIYAPGDISEALDISRESFTITDTYQLPVFVLGDQYFADSIYTIEKIETRFSLREYTLYDSAYKRYSLNTSGVSPITYPGIGEALVQVDSDEHDESAHITEDLTMRVKMQDKRLAKRSLLEKEMRVATWSGPDTADIILVSWGSNKMIVAEAAHYIPQAAALHFSQVYPLFPSMLPVLKDKKVIVIENNATGQFEQLLKLELGVAAWAHVRKYNGECFTVQEIIAAVMEALS